MKIAIVSPVMVPVPPLKYGGIERIVDELARGLAKRKHKVTVFCAGDSTIEGENLFRVESSPYSTKECLEENRAWEIRQLLSVLSRQREFDVIHFNYEPIVCRLNIDGVNINLLDFFATPLALTFHNTTYIPEHIKYYRKTESLHRHNMIFISENQRQPVSFFPRSQVIYNALPLEQFPFEDKKEDYLLFLGRIANFKGILEAIEVAKKTKIPLKIVAKIDRVDQKFYKKEVEAHIDGKLIQYMGEADFAGKVEYFKKARCLLFPILWEEPFGLVMTEALACGTPVIAFRRGSVPEIIQDGINGYIVDTVDEMVDAIGKLKNISSLNCRKSVEERFSLERMVKEYENLFSKLASK
ncbi:MAG: Glycosyl transferase, group 1 [Candidatus Berkelbacteria bacterium Licking1014_7]|uniref:Glycosyl transferase, group 1 n=1 Tax=Candidatus Berkelbacteria bacterium Licking1014_7 TaxID=2017147 RepID=A0A554LHT5_9BACT|nr:MAG: Glycosyl transferase, group 1 [Candidatus Berkelbacteria bacterium Licking1014_7]